MANRGYDKPSRPILERGHGLASHCVHAMAPWEWGCRATTALTEHDEVTGVRGVVDGSIGAVYTNDTSGRMITAGPSSIDPISWGGAVQTKAVAGATGTFTLAVLWKARAAVTDDMILWAKGNSESAANSFGFAIGTANAFWCWTRDGAGSDEVTDPNAITVGETYLHVVQGGGSVVGAGNNVLRLWRNGARVAQASPGVPNRPVGNVQSTRMFGDSAKTAATLMDAGISMVALWPTVLPDSAVQQLWTDPYTMFKRSHDDFMGFDLGVGGQFQNYLLSF